MTKRGLQAWLPDGVDIPEVHRTAFIPVPASLPDQGVRGIVLEECRTRVVVSFSTALSVARRARRWSVPYAARQLGIRVSELRRLERSKTCDFSPPMQLLRRLWDGDE